jgi:hypothetical protein
LLQGGYYAQSRMASLSQSRIGGTFCFFEKKYPSDFFQSGFAGPNPPQADAFYDNWWLFTY